jgi:hypothetical protein
MLPVASGVINKFDPIASGIALWDYITNAGLVNGYSNSYNCRNTLVYKVDATLAGLSYDHSFHAAYVSGITPVQVRYLIT